MPTQVHLMPSAKKKLDYALHHQICEELGTIFATADSVSVYDVVLGFEPDQRKKVILAVEVHHNHDDPARSVYETYIVKLGERRQVKPDAVAWEQHIKGRPMSQLMFVPVRLHKLRGAAKRAAAVYQDAGQWYGRLTPSDEVGTLAWAVDKALFTDEIDVCSVERVVGQVFRELGRSFYRSAREDSAATRQFYRSKLTLESPNPLLAQWKEEPQWRMRRDVDWLLCGSLSPGADALPEYLDPYDYITAMLASDQAPPTLVGVTHGDCHAGNVLVAVADKEIEYPLIIDYGDMSPGNVALWDMVKLETELKVRLMAQLFKCAAVRKQVWRHLANPHLKNVVARCRQRQGTDPDPLAERLQQIVFAYEFERRLARQMEAELEAPGMGTSSVVAPRSPLARALRVLHAIRRQAAEQVGRSPNHTGSWLEKHNFALAVYGLSTIKFGNLAYPPYQRLFALISAGMAVARLKQAQDQIREARTQPLAGLADSAIYHVPLRRAYHEWKVNRHLSDAEQLLGKVVERFDYAVPLRREHSLLQSKLGRLDAASETLSRIGPPRALGEQPTTLPCPELANLCESFLEVEVLSRLGRINKDKADAYWQTLELPYDQLCKDSAVLFYRSAFEFYRRAFELSHNYYPGGNAAVTALLAGEAEESRRIALAVEAECTKFNTGDLDPTECFWVIATKADMHLLRDEPAAAANLYRTALRQLPAHSDGVVQATYAQLCRLYKVLGKDRMLPVLIAFREANTFSLQKGPLGDCDGLFAEHAGG